MADMERGTWKEKLEQGFAELTPDRWDEISKAVSGCKASQPVWEDSYRKPVRRRIPAMIAVAAALLCVVFAVNIKDEDSVRSMLYLDVNPSVCMSVNERGKVIDIEGINADGCKVADAALEDLGKSRDPGDAVSCIVEEIDEEGYFSDGTVDMLVSLSYTGKEDKELLDKARRIIEEYARSKNMTSSLMTQSFARDENAEKAAADMGISPGKYAYLDRLVKEGRIDQYRIGEFAEKPASEINRIIEENPEKTEPDKEPEKAAPAEEQEENIVVAEQTENEAVTEQVYTQKSYSDPSVKNKTSKKKTVKSSKKTTKKEKTGKTKGTRKEKAAEKEEKGKGEASGGIGNLDKIRSENAKLNETEETGPKETEPKEEESRG
jgi:hypothetical protein